MGAGGKTSPKGRPTRGRPRSRNATRARSNTTLVALAAALIGIVVAVGFAAGGSSHKDKASSLAPASFDLPALNGPGRIRLADHTGKPVVLNFFASWCSACDFELPGFSRVSDHLRGKVTFIGVNSLETGDPNLMPRRHNITWWPLARDVGGSNASGLHDALGGGNSMPLTAFYDSSGRLVDVERAALPEDALRAKISQLFGITA